jgi:hypothetical protein
MSKKDVLEVKEDLVCVRDNLFLELRSNEEAGDEYEIKIGCILTLLATLREVTVRNTYCGVKGVELALPVKR